MKVYVLFAISRKITDGQDPMGLIDHSSDAIGVFTSRNDALDAMDAYPSVDDTIEPKPYIHDMNGYPWHMDNAMAGSEIGFTIEEFEVGWVYPFGIYPRQGFKI